MEVWKHRRREELLCRKSLVPPLECKGGKATEQDGELCPAEKGTSLWFSVWVLGSSGGAFMDVVSFWD